MNMTVEKGMSFVQTAKQAQRIAIDNNTHVDFKFNDVHIRFDRDSFF